MARKYPIWNNVNSCIYNSSKSYGAKDTGAVTVCVGTSRQNSEILVQHVTTRRIQGDYTVFRFGVDTGNGLQVLKTLWMHTKTQAWFETEPEELKTVSA